MAGEDNDPEVVLACSIFDGWPKPLREKVANSPLGYDFQGILAISNFYHRVGLQATLDALSEIEADFLESSHDG